MAATISWIPLIEQVKMEDNNWGVPQFHTTPWCWKWVYEEVEGVFGDDDEPQYSRIRQYCSI